MKKLTYTLLFYTALIGPVAASDTIMDMISVNNTLNLNRSAKQRTTASQIRRNLTFSTIGDDYSEFKNELNKTYGLDFSFDISYMGQRGTPDGKKNAMQTIRVYFQSKSWATAALLCRRLFVGSSVLGLGYCTAGEVLA